MPNPTFWNRLSFYRQIVFCVSGLVGALCLAGVPVLADSAPIFQNAAAKSQPETVPLPKVPTEFKLRPNQVHRYSVDLEGGEFLKIDFEQKGMDLYLIVENGHGKKLFHCNRLESDRGIEPIYFSSETPIRYFVIVGCIYQEDIPGSYEVRPTVHRPPTPQDQHLLRAQELNYEAETIGRAAKDKADFQKSLDTYLEAAREFHAAGDLASEAIMTVFAGRIERTFGNLPKSIEYCTNALKLLETQPDLVIQAAALTNIGRSYRLMEQFETALDYYEQALVLRRKTDDLVGESIELNNIGSVYVASWEYRKAEEYLKRSLEISQRVGNVSGLASNLGNLATINASLGDFEKTLLYTMQSYQLLVKLNDQNREISILAQIGNLYLKLGKIDEATEYFQKGLDLSVRIGNRQQQIIILHDLARLPNISSATSLQYLNQSLVLARTLKSQIDEGAALALLGQFHLDQNNIQEAFSYLTQANQIFEATRNQSQIGRIWRFFGKAYVAEKNYPLALEQFQKSLASSEQRGDRTATVNLLNDLALTHLQLGQYDEARADLERAIQLVEQIRSTVLDQSFRLSYFSSTQSLFENYIYLLMELHRRNPSAGYDREAFQKNEARRARSLLELLLLPGEGLPDEGSTGLLSQEQNLIERILAREQNLTKTLAESARRERVTRIQEEISALYNDYRKTQIEIRKQSPHYASLTQPQPLSVEQVQQTCLDDNTLLLEYSLGTPHSYLWVISKTDCHVFQLAGKAEIEAKTRALYECLKLNPLKRIFFNQETSDKPDTPPANCTEVELTQLAREVSDLVVGPVAKKLGTKRLLVVADGALHYLPFGVLSTPGQSSYVPLVVEHEIVSIPSATTLALIRQEHTARKPADGTLALFADPVFEPSDPRLKVAGVRGPETEGQKSPPPHPDITETVKQLASGQRNLMAIVSDYNTRLQLTRLPFTRTEATNILRMIPRTDKVLTRFDFEANRDALFSEELSRFRYVHLATHGYFDPKKPEQSALILSLVGPDGKTQDGFVRTSDIYRLNLHADLVVLSACETGLGANIQGEGLVGLTRGFMYAGAPRVMVTLWSVNDRATSELMTRFYQKILKQKMSPSAALRAAQLELYRSKKYASPFYWAAFTLHGEY